MIVRLLNLDEERDLFIEAYNWRYDAPRWFQECLDIWKETLEDYLENAKDELHYGVWDDEVFVAVIRLIQDASGLFNIHLSVRRGTDWNVLLAAGNCLREFLRSVGVSGTYGYLPVINKSISKLYQCLGFSDTGIRVFKGVVHGRLMEWQHYLLVLNPRKVYYGIQDQNNY
jgi:hypothetical protein